MKSTSLALFLLALLPSLLLAGQTHDDIAGRPDLDILDADRQLPGTRVVSTLDTKHEKSMNLMYCATLQLAWNELMDMLDGPVKLEGDPPSAKSLNKKDFTREMLDKPSYYVFAGMGPDAPDRIRAGLQEHFAGAASPKLIPTEILGPREFVTYAYLYKNLEFPVPFYAYTRSLKFGSAHTTSFGVPTNGPDREAQLKNVVIHDYRNDDDFVFELKSKSPDRLIVARTEPADSLEKTVNQVLDRLHKTRRSTLDHYEMVQVPGFNFELVKQFGDLAPRKLFHKSWPEPGKLKEVAQLIRFKLNERGAVLKSEAKLKGSVGESSIDGGSTRSKPRYFICDKPFLILMLRPDQKKPYFAMWVENPELMVKVPDAPAVKSGETPAPPQPPAVKRRGSTGQSNIDD